MELEEIVKNVKILCEARGVSPTKACVESGVGRTFLAGVAKGSAPSVLKLQQLASYLGVTTSALLGEVPLLSAKITAAQESSGSWKDASRIIDGLSPEEQMALLAEVLKKYDLVEKKETPVSPNQEIPPQEQV